MPDPVQRASKKPSAVPLPAMKNHERQAGLAFDQQLAKLRQPAASKSTAPAPVPDDKLKAQATGTSPKSRSRGHNDATDQSRAPEEQPAAARQKTDAQSTEVDTALAEVEAEPAENAADSATHDKDHDKKVVPNGDDLLAAQAGALPGAVAVPQAVALADPKTNAAQTQETRPVDGVSADTAPDSDMFYRQAGSVSALDDAVQIALSASAQPEAVENTSTAKADQVATGTTKKPAKVAPAGVAQEDSEPASDSEHVSTDQVARAAGAQVARDTSDELPTIPAPADDSSSDARSSSAPSADHGDAELASRGAAADVAGARPAAQITRPLTHVTSASPQPSPQATFTEVNHPNIVQGIQGQLLPRGGTMQIRLDPPELGALQVSVHLRDGVMSASFVTSNDQATQLLSHSLTQLKHALETQGVSVEKIHVEQSARSHDRGAAQDGQSQQRSGHEGSDHSEQQRRELLARMWRRLSMGDDPLDMVA